MTESNLQKAQRINKILLQEFKKLCNENHLNYYLMCGGLLGAVRHKDIIPWDDDVDIAITRSDFEKLKKIARKRWKKNTDFYFLEPNRIGKGAFLDFYPRLVYMKESVPLKTYRKVKGKIADEIDNHVPLDIYILDNAPDEEGKFQKLYFKLRVLYCMSMGHRTYVDYDEYRAQRMTEKQIEQLKLLITVGKWIPFCLLYRLYDYFSKRYFREETGNYFVSNGNIGCAEWRHKKNWFGEGIELSLGELKMNAPKEYEEELKLYYTNYMQLPPEEKRRPDHVIMEESYGQE